MEPTTKIIKGNTEQEVWNQLQEDFKDSDAFVDDYEAVIQQEDTTIHLHIEIDLGGGFESGYESTTFLSQFQLSEPFEFLLEEEGFLLEIGKLLGMEDVEIGDLQFDDKVRIKTNNPARLKKVFQSVENREFLETLSSFKLSLSLSDDEPSLYQLELQLDEAVVDPLLLRATYHVFHSLVKEILG